MKAYPAETTEAFLDGHVSAFALLGGAPQSILYDNTKLAVARNWATGVGSGRGRSPSCSPTTCSRTGSVVKGNDKGKVLRAAHFLVPVPRVESFEALNAQRCLERMDAYVGQRMERDLDALAAVPYDACDKQPSRVSSLSRYRTRCRWPTDTGRCWSGLPRW